MVHICLPLHDASGQYSKFVGTAICSVLENTKVKIMVHILCDETLTENNKNKLRSLVESYSQNIAFYQVTIDERLYGIKALEVFSIGTLLRLYIDNVLNVDRVIYLDADVIVKMDINQLWEHNESAITNTCAISACMDEPLSQGWWHYSFFDKGVFDIHEYFNAGVLVLNLTKIRKNYDLLEQAIAFFTYYPESKMADQDALNYIFKNDHYLLPRQYNTFVAGERKNHIHKLESCIYHYSGEDGRSNYYQQDVFDKLFWHYLLKTPWGSQNDLQKFYEGKLLKKHREKCWLQMSLKKIFSGKKIFWGSSGKLHEFIRGYFSVDIQLDYYVDNNKDMWGKFVKNLLVKAPDGLIEQEKGSFSIIVVTLQYKTVKEQLESFGYIEDQDFFEGRKFLPEAEGGYSEWNV